MFFNNPFKLRIKSLSRLDIFKNGKCPLSRFQVQNFSNLTLATSFLALLLSKDAVWYLWCNYGKNWTVRHFSKTHGIWIITFFWTLASWYWMEKIGPKRRRNPFRKVWAHSQLDRRSKLSLIRRYWRLQICLRKDRAIWRSLDNEVRSL